MKKIVVLLVVTVFAVSFGFAGGKSDSSSRTGEMSVALLINGTLGDRSFHDSANNGISLISGNLNCNTRVVEIGYDSTRWEPALRDLCDGSFDIIICGTWQMQEVVQRVVPDYPNQKIIIYDTTMDYANDSGGVYKNIYSIEYRQNDGAFLAGVLAARMTESGTIGFVGGMDNTVICDFLVGYIQGAKTVNPETRVLSSFVGNFSDSARAMELALAQIQMGADIVFSCASNAGEGVLQAAKDRGVYAIGVDSDQAMLYMDSDPRLANLIVTSVMKRVDQSIYLAVKEAMDGTLKWGTRVALGLSDDCIGLADNEVYRREVPQSVRDEIAAYAESITNGEIEVITAFDMPISELTAYINSAAL